MTRLTGVRIVLIVLLLTITGMLVGSDMRLIQNVEDFRAFYCASEAIEFRHDPYLAEPLRSCEIRETREAGLLPYKNLAIPAPLPGHALAAFAPLTLIDFPRASTLFTLAQIVALGASTAVISEIAGVSIALAFPALFLSAGLLSVKSGQLIVFVLFALCMAARSLHTQRYARAAFWTTCATLEPHIALPAIVALAIFEKRSRAPLAVCLGVCAALSLLALGPAANIDYLVHVLPAHALSEAGSGKQYSLTTLLVHANVPAVPALAIANVQYAFMCVLGIVVARAYARKYARPEMLVLLPPAFAALGGPFIHLTQVAIAIPALLVLTRDTAAFRKGFAGIALLAIAIPWLDVISDASLATLVFAAFVALAIATLIWPRNVGAIALALTCCVAIMNVQRAFNTMPIWHVVTAVGLDHVSGPNLLSEVSWQVYEQDTVDLDATRTLPARIPTWIGLLMTVIVATVAVTDRRRPATLA